jgi:fructose-1,6-bisphosphatase/inositol monophosphatase family enzyme
MSKPIDKFFIDQLMREMAAKYITPRFQSLQSHEIKTKSGPNDLVTHADIETEQALTSALQKNYPGCVVIGEEAASRGDISMSEILKNPPELLFVIDPVDGTWNFAHGKSVFCSMLAAVINGTPIMGWIYDVTKDTMAYAEKGQGAYYGDEQLQTSQSKSRDQLEGYIGLHFLPKLIRPTVQENTREVANVQTLRCAGHEYLRLASAQADFAIFSKTEPWDHLPGILLTEEAGGVSARHDRATYDLTNRKQIILSASTQTVWEDIHELFIAPVAPDIPLGT